MFKKPLIAAACFFTITCNAKASNEEQPTLESLSKEADTVLALPNVSARNRIDVVYKLIDRLLEEEDEATAEKYLAQALKHDPWNLKYQVIYAHLLFINGKSKQAYEKLEIVLERSKDQKIIEEAEQLLSWFRSSQKEQKDPLYADEHSVVLVPLQGADEQLLVAIQDKIADILGISVRIEAIDINTPQASRDKLKLIISKMRKKLIGSKPLSPTTVDLMSEFKVTINDLKDDDLFIDFLRYISSLTSPEALKNINAMIKTSAGKSPQWAADKLHANLLEEIKDYRRKKEAYLGITPKDIYSDDYNFLFGWANNQAGIMSYHRFIPPTYNQNNNDEVLIKRATMQALSSIGHIYKLERCTTPTCARAYPHSLAEHDAKQGTLCSQCTNGFKKAFTTRK